MGDAPAALTREGLLAARHHGRAVIGALLVIGLVVGVFQAATQINDPAVGFLPRFAAALGAMWFLGGWLLERYSGFFAASVERMTRR